MTELEALAAGAAVCTQCALCETRTKTVFGVGNPEADLMFVGEAPGHNEDLKGEPFVGRAGELLNELLAEIGIDREDVYIANVLKCRPPGNRDPHPVEIETCVLYLDRQIELIAPLVVVTLGNFATKYLLQTSVGITRLRGRRFKFRNAAALIPTFHPAAVLRSGGTKLEDMRHDFAVIGRSIGAARDRRTGGSVPEPAAASPAMQAGAPHEEQLELF